ncbi:MAG: pyrroline-5-carboxylate reductase [Oscillospiraceae bacterium]|nr:pyrroline-5-carboxylate reductase [Oscillospiraceae bacterium]
MKKIAFIGAGNMGGALVMGICKAIDPEQVIIYDPDIEKTATLSSKTGCIVADSADSAVADSEYVVLAVKPQILRGVQQNLVSAMQKAAREGKKQIILSIAAGITLADLATIPLENGLDLPVIRMLPNTPSEIGEGLNIYAVNDRMTDEKCDELQMMFSQCGLTEKVTEHILDVASAVSGCTPAFAYMFVDALADGAVRCGVPRDKAIKYAAQAVKGAAAMVLETGRHPDVLKDAVCSPGGSTIVGVATLENAAFRAAAANAVFYANEKNKDLGKK